MGLDTKALNILFARFGPPSKGQRTSSIAPDEFAYAKQAGYMFDPVALTHDEIITWLVELRETVARKAVTDAFIASLGRRRLDQRSALGSLGVASWLPEHRIADAPTEAMPSGRIQCLICGLFAGPETYDFNILNFERHKWGGVRHDDPLYAAFDLAQFAKTAAETPTLSDYAILARILGIAASLPSAARLSDLELKLSGLFQSNRWERRILIQCLAYCGIVAPVARPGFFRAFTPLAKRTWPPANKIDWSYPACWWRGSDGINREALWHYFPEIARTVTARRIDDRHQ